MGRIAQLCNPWRNAVSGHIDENRPNQLYHQTRAAMEEAAEFGISDLTGQLKYAERVLKHEYAAAKGVVQSTASQNQAAQRRQEKRRQGVKPMPDSSGSLPQQPGEEQNSNLSPGQRLLAQMKADGDA